MPFLQVSTDVAIGSIEGERALRLVRAGRMPTFVETEDGARLFGIDCHDEPNGEVHLTAEHINALGRFCARMFMGEPPDEHLKQIRDAAAFAIVKLEEWNDRARADEEHPPYVDITNRLRVIEYALGQLARGLVPPDDRGQFGA